VNQRDAEVLAQVCVDYCAKAGKFALILNDLKDGNYNAVNAWLNLLAMNFQGFFLSRSEMSLIRFSPSIEPLKGSIKTKRLALKTQKVYPIASIEPCQMLN